MSDESKYCPRCESFHPESQPHFDEVGRRDETAAPVPQVKYNFRVKGCYPDGNTTTMEGCVYDDDNFPQKAFDKAVDVCKQLTPSLIVDLTQPGQVTLSKRKK
jgi:hypothetical protein